MVSNFDKFLLHQMLENRIRNGSFFLGSFLFVCLQSIVRIKAKKQLIENVKDRPAGFERTN